MKNSEFNITIVGLGLIGGSYAMALKKLKPKNLWGVDIDVKAINTAEQLNIIDKGYVGGKIPLSKSDIVIIALYPDASVKFIRDNLEYFKRGSLITDTASIKEKVVNEVSSFIPDCIDFIGGHPMAGKEYKGLKFASGDTFINASYILTPTEKNKKENVDLLKKIALGMGFKNVITVEPKIHDEMVAYTSGTPHIIAVALMAGADLDDEGSCFVGGSFKDATRVARINSALWCELISSNRENILKKLENFEEKLALIKDAVINDDKDAMIDMFEMASAKRGKLNDRKQH